MSKKVKIQEKVALHFDVSKAKVDPDLMYEMIKALSMEIENAGHKLAPSYRYTIKKHYADSFSINVVAKDASALHNVVVRSLEKISREKNELSAMAEMLKAEMQ